MRDINDPDRVFLEFKQGKVWWAPRRRYSNLQESANPSLRVDVLGVEAFELWDCGAQMVTAVGVSPTHYSSKWMERVLDVVYPGGATTADMYWDFDDMLRLTFPALWVTAATMSLRDISHTRPTPLLEPAHGGYYSRMIINLVHLLNE